MGRGFDGGGILPVPGEDRQRPEDPETTKRLEGEKKRYLFGPPFQAAEEPDGFNARGIGGGPAKPTQHEEDGERTDEIEHEKALDLLGDAIKPVEVHEDYVDVEKYGVAEEDTQRTRDIEAEKD